jgi:phage shock protein C
MRMSRRLLRSRTDTVIGGVAAGLAQYLNADPALVRIAWAVLVPITGGAALLAYIVAWIVVPEAPKAATAEAVGGDPEAAGSVAEPAARNDGRAGIVVGIGLVLVGAWFLLRQYLPEIDWGLVWPIVIIGIGIVILVTTTRRRTDG